MLKSFDKFKFDKNFFVNVLSIAIPLMLQQLIVSGVNLIDNLMVGQLGDISLGGVTAVNKYYMVATTGMFGMTTAAGVFLAQYYGAKNNDRLKQTFRFMLVSTLLLGTVFFLIGFLFPENVLRYFTNDLLVISEGINYFKYAIFTLLAIIPDTAAHLAAAMGASLSGQYTQNKLDRPFHGVYYGQSAMPLPGEEIVYLTNSVLDGCIATDYESGTVGGLYDMDKAAGKDPDRKSVV